MGIVPRSGWATTSVEAVNLWWKASLLTVDQSLVLGDVIGFECWNVSWHSLPRQLFLHAALLLWTRRVRDNLLIFSITNSNEQ